MQQVIEEEVVKYEVKQPGDESSESSESSEDSTSKSGSESGYSSGSESEVDLKPKKKKNVIVDDVDEIPTDAAPDDQEISDVPVDDPTVENQETNEPCARSDEPEQKNETAPLVPETSTVTHDDEEVSVV